MLSADYPDDFKHPGLQAVWFRDVPWTVQQRVLAVNDRLRCIRNPATGVFVVVLQLNGADRQRIYPFFNVAKLVGWAPLLETDRKQPVEAIHRICEGMEASARFADAHYGETPEQIDAALKRDQRRGEELAVNAMLESTAFARRFAQEFAMKHLAMTVSNAKGGRLYEEAHREFVQERNRRNAAAEKQPLVVVGR